MAAKAKKVDWNQVGIEYRAGILTSVAIGKNHGISHTAVNKRAKAEGWTRDLSKRIDAARQAKVSRAMVSPKVAAQLKATDEQVVQATADFQVAALAKHRNGIDGLFDTTIKTGAELGALTNTYLQDALELVRDEKVSDLSNQQAKTALYKAFNAALAIGSRAAAVRSVVSAAAILIDKDRQNLGIDKESGANKSVGEFLDSL